MPETTPKKELERDDALKQAYREATNALRNVHRAASNDLYTKHAKALGHDWSPRPTQKQKDEEAFKALLAEHPEFAGLVAKPDENVSS